MSSQRPRKISEAWFHAAEAAGDFMGIRYGRISNGEMQWFNVSHCECDGIGGFARLLRKGGAKIPNLPETKNPVRGVFLPLWRLLRNREKTDDLATRDDWQLDDPLPEKKLAWHLFTIDETRAIVDQCRNHKITVNTYLLHCLDRATRPEIRTPEKKITWMVPVNLRGDIHHADDTQNHVSCVDVRIGATDSSHSIHQQILDRLDRGEHRANYLLLITGGILSHEAKVNLLRKDRLKPHGNIGAFSNLGVWNVDELSDVDGWVFCPPMVTGQRLGAGCVTFNGRLGLATQGGPSEQRMKSWVANIGEPCLRPAS